MISVSGPKCLALGVSLILLASVLSYLRLDGFSDFAFFSRSTNGVITCKQHSARVRIERRKWRRSVDDLRKLTGAGGSTLKYYYCVDALPTTLVGSDVSLSIGEQVILTYSDRNSDIATFGTRRDIITRYAFFAAWNLILFFVGCSYIGDFLKTRRSIN